MRISRTGPNLLATSTSLLPEITRVQRLSFQSQVPASSLEDVSDLASLQNLINICLGQASSRHIVHFIETLILSTDGHKSYCQLASYFLIPLNGKTQKINLFWLRDKVLKPLVALAGAG